MRISPGRLVFGALFLIFGYLSYNQAATIFLSDFAGTISDIRSILIAPLFSAIYYLLYYGITEVIFRKLAVYKPGKEIAFSAMFFVANILLLLLTCKLFAWQTAGDLAGTTELMNIDNQPIAIAYLVASVVAFILFTVIRKKWR
ncbi:hypothetical protein [Candidatus Pantoea multigeneris]|uniref:Uncharacterized protein n=1 Tax=Candidatus Pantoea multigeneris TaxID=2608357 RepID=A0ABX0RKX7_9GAMM|nr:hypothetical protein [Pantoea multigeneris]NIF24249.1 hypothetical protein [Pantoea multigeneris]